MITLHQHEFKINDFSFSFIKLFKSVEKNHAAAVQEASYVAS